MDLEKVLEIRSEIFDVLDKHKMTYSQVVDIMTLCLLEVFQKNGMPYEDFKEYMNHKFDLCEEDWPVG